MILSDVVGFKRGGSETSSIPPRQPCVQLQTAGPVETGPSRRTMPSTPVISTCPETRTANAQASGPSKKRAGGKGGWTAKPVVGTGAPDGADAQLSVPVLSTSATIAS